VPSRPYGKKWDVAGTFKDAKTTMPKKDVQSLALCQPWSAADKCSHVARGSPTCANEDICKGEKEFYKGYDMRSVKGKSKWKFNGYSAFVHTLCGVYSGFAFPAEDRGAGMRQKQMMKYASNVGFGCKHAVVELCPKKSWAFKKGGGFTYPPPAAPKFKAGDDKSFKIKIVNKLEKSAKNPCTKYGGNSIKIFRPGAPKGDKSKVGPGGQGRFTDRFASGGGLGIQINSWYWPKNVHGDSKPSPSAVNFKMSSNCGRTKFQDFSSKTKEVRTDFVADVLVSKDRDGTCVITIQGNKWTDAVTPDCCKDCKPKAHYQGGFSTAHEDPAMRAWPGPKGWPVSSLKASPRPSSQKSSGSKSSSKKGASPRPRPRPRSASDCSGKCKGMSKCEAIQGNGWCSKKCFKGSKEYYCSQDCQCNPR